MGRRKREPMSEGKRNIIAGLLQEYDIRTAKDIEDALKDLLDRSVRRTFQARTEDNFTVCKRYDDPSDKRNY